MKISQIITEQYENQDPNRHSDLVDIIGDQYWYDTNGNRHRDGDLPAFISQSGRKTWWQHGLRHRDGDKPAFIGADGSKAWYQHGMKHRETGPSVIWYDGTVEFWLNGNEYSIEKWAEKVGMRKHELIMMKHKLGLD